MQDSVSSLRHPRAIRSTTVAWVVLVAIAAFLALGSVFDLIADARGTLPSDHSSTFKALTGTTLQHAAKVQHSATPYVTHVEVGYAVYELLFAALFLAVAMIPLRHGDRWAWWCCWLIIGPLATFAALFGAHNSGTLSAAIIAAVIAVVALFVLRPRDRTRGDHPRGSAAAQ